MYFSFGRVSNPRQGYQRLAQAVIYQAMKDEDERFLNSKWGQSIRELALWEETEKEIKPSTQSVQS